MKNALLTLVAAATVSACTGMADGGTVKRLWQTDGFAVPESVLVDPARQELIVTNMAGAPNEANGTGYLSLVALDGTMLDPQWVTGLDAPKGMALVGTKLYVADITKIRIIDVEEGAVIRTIDVPGSVFLNDVTASPDGQVFVSDMMTNTIYSVKDGALETWLQDPALKMPNGLLVDGDRLIVGTWGTGMRPDFTTETPGDLLTIDMKSKAISIYGKAADVGNLDGVVKVGDMLYVTDYIKGVLLKVTPDGTVTTAMKLHPSSADIYSAGNRIYIPIMMMGKLGAVEVSGS